MLNWIANICLIGMVAFIGFMICIAVDNRNVGKMIIAIAILLGLQATIENLSPVVERWAARVDSIQNSIDKVSNFGKGGWEMPMKGQITQYFSPSKPHNGIDIGAALGTPVRASRKGIVKLIQQHNIYGLMVVIDHGDGYESLYAHNSKSVVKEGYPVIAGSKIAECGNSGKGDGGYHLHFEIRLNGRTVDPMQYLR